MIKNVLTLIKKNKDEKGKETNTKKLSLFRSKLVSKFGKKVKHVDFALFI